MGPYSSAGTTPGYNVQAGACQGAAMFGEPTLLQVLSSSETSTHANHGASVAHGAFDGLGPPQIIIPSSLPPHMLAHGGLALPHVSHAHRARYISRSTRSSAGSTGVFTLHDSSSSAFTPPPLRPPPLLPPPLLPLLPPPPRCAREHQNGAALGATGASLPPMFEGSELQVGGHMSGPHGSFAGGDAR